MAPRRKIKKSTKCDSECESKNSKYIELNPVLNQNNNILLERNPESHQTESRNPTENEEPPVAPYGKSFYPCKCEIPPKKITCKTHENLKIKSEGEIHYSGVQTAQNNSINQKSETARTPPKIVISQNTTIQSATNRDSEDNEEILIPRKAPKYDLSIYDYDEEDDEERTPKSRETQCKMCPFVGDDVIELLRHKRSEHATPKKFLPPHELRKYFDYPDRNFCPVCKKPIKTKNYRSIFIRHLLVHSAGTAGLMFQCKICKNKFRRNDQLREHEKRHIISFAEAQAIQDAVYEDEVFFRYKGSVD